MSATVIDFSLWAGFITRFAAVTSAWRAAVLASTSTMTALCTSIR